MCHWWQYNILTITKLNYKSFFYYKATDDQSPKNLYGYNCLWVTATMKLITHQITLTKIGLKIGYGTETMKYSSHQKPININKK